jgi:hypothetical protein
MSAFIVVTHLAYVDPSTGGLIFQFFALVFAGVSGGLFFFSRQTKSALARIRRFMHERLSRS